MLVQYKLVYPNYTTFEEQTRVDIEREQFLTELKTLKKNMHANNTIILGVLGESPYAETNGDVGVPYCKNVSVLGGDGCLYDYNLNPYLPENERITLDLDYEKFDHSVIASIK